MVERTVIESNLNKLNGLKRKLDELEERTEKLPIKKEITNLLNWFIDNGIRLHYHVTTGYYLN